jgi:hypothetical protein
MFRPLQSVPNVEIRLHATILYNSIFRGDDQLFVNTHIYGIMAKNAPFFHSRKIPGAAIAANYLALSESTQTRSTFFSTRATARYARNSLSCLPRVR